jgi:hypothetical protein
VGGRVLRRAKKGACTTDDFQLFFVDETTISLRFPIRACWMKRGQQKRIPAFTSPNHSYHLIGAYHWAKDQVFTQAVECKNSQTFIQFLEYLLIEQFPTQKIILVLDNASYHQGKASMAALSLFEPDRTFLATS